MKNVTKRSLDCVGEYEQASFVWEYSSPHGVNEDMINVILKDLQELSSSGIGGGWGIKNEKAYIVIPKKGQKVKFVI